MSRYTLHVRQIVMLQSWVRGFMARKRFAPAIKQNRLRLKKRLEDMAKLKVVSSGEDKGETTQEYEDGTKYKGTPQLAPDA